MAKFKFENVHVGSIVTMQDQDGEKFDLVVNQLLPNGTPYPIGVKTLKPITVYRGLDSSGARAVEHFDARDVLTFTEEGWYSLRSAGDIRLVAIKKPWKEFKEDRRLKAGMKVKIKQNGKWIKGIVAECGCVEGHCSVDFESGITSPSGNSDRTRTYTEAGIFVWPGRHEMSLKLRIRQYK